MGRKRAMSSKVASQKKLSGHAAEHTFAQLIGGQVNKGSPQDKKDVIDAQHRAHSVKQGQYWQIFLYRRSRLETNTILRGIGGIADALIACLDAFPEARKDYLADKIKCKLALQEPMRNLCHIMQDAETLRAFYDKALFNGGEVNYLSVLQDDVWHIFPALFVVTYLANLEIANSRAITATQFSDQKVLIKDGTNLGEIEVRNDSDTHYREAKFRIDGHRLIPGLIKAAGELAEARFAKEVMVYEKAIRTFKVGK